jgi:hypothetical protein
MLNNVGCRNKSTVYSMDDSDEACTIPENLWKDQVVVQCLL